MERNIRKIIKIAYEIMYPRTITIEHPKLKELLIKKAELVNMGRAKSDEIDIVEKEMAEIDQQIVAEEKKVNTDDLLEKEKVVTKKVEEAIEEMKAIKQEIFDRIKKEVPAELYTKYETLEENKKRMEEERNKIALKAQKYNDKIIPIGREMMKPFLEDIYEDYDSLYLENGEIVATIFSHLQDFKTNFKKK